MKIIAITGVQGSGKSTLTARLQSLCQRQGLQTCVVTEVADRCPYPLNLDTSTKAQKWIWCEQMRAELDARSTKPDVIICDRSMMDNLCYLALVDHPDAKDAFAKRYGITHKWMLTQYDYVCRLPLNEKWLQSFNNPNRCRDLGFARRVDAVMNNLVQRYVNTTPEALIDMCSGNRKT